MPILLRVDVDAARLRLGGNRRGGTTTIFP